MVIERTGGLGDMICLLPSAGELRRQHPGLPLIIVTAKDFIPLVELTGIADYVVPSDSRGLSWLCAGLNRTADLRPQLPDERVPPQPRARIPLVHEFAKEMGMPIEKLAPLSIAPARKDLASVHQKLKANGIDSQMIITVHSGPTWPVKQWPVRHWTTLVDQLKKQCSACVIQTGAEIPVGMMEPRIPGALDWVGQLTLAETLALMSLSRLFVGVDSGMLHLAGCAGIPILGLFGPTAPECFLPQRKTARGIASDLHCAGCHHHPEGPQHWRTGCSNDIRCMADLSVETALRECVALLA